MKLYEIPNKSKIYEEVSDGSSYFIYDHPDGMYSYCVSEKGGVCHLGLSQELEVFEDGYKFKKNQLTMNQTNNRIREEIEEEFIEILECGKNLKGEEVWTDLEKVQWLRKKIDELLKSQREEERLRSAKIVEELMEDGEHWQPIASRIMDRVIIGKEDLSLIKNN